MSGFGQPPSYSGGYGAPPGSPGSQPGGFGAPPGYQPGGFGAPPGMAHHAAPPGEMPNFVLWMIIGFGQIVLCGNPLFGVPAGVLALLGKNEWDQGKYDTATGKLKISKIISIIGLSLMGLSIIGLMTFYIFFFAVAAAAAASSPAY